VRKGRNSEPADGFIFEAYGKAFFNGTIEIDAEGFIPVRYPKIMAKLIMVVRMTPRESHLRG